MDELAQTPNTDFTAAAEYLNGYAITEQAIRRGVEKPSILIEELAGPDGAIHPERLRGAFGRLLNTHKYGRLMNKESQ